MSEIFFPQTNVNVVAIHLIFQRFKNNAVPYNYVAFSNICIVHLRALRGIKKIIISLQMNKLFFVQLSGS